MLLLVRQKSQGFQLQLLAIAGPGAVAAVEVGILCFVLPVEQRVRLRDPCLSTLLAEKSLGGSADCRICSCSLCRS